jgi:hypothetical protein
MMNTALIKHVLEHNRVRYRFEQIDPTVTRPRSWSFFSPDGAYEAPYRWALGREWFDAGPIMTFVMLNPSTATSYVRDRTDQQCEMFARREHAAGMLLVNLFAYRATSPIRLIRAQAQGVDVEGPANLPVIRQATRVMPGRTMTVLAYGAWAGHPVVLSQALLTIGMLDAAGTELYTLGVTAKGHPRHPCRLAHDTKLELRSGVHLVSVQ